MTRLDDLEAVVQLAFVTEDRTDAEQRALLRVCDDIDRQRNKQTVVRTNYTGTSRLYDEAQATRVLVDKQRHVELKKRHGLPREAVTA